MCDPSLPDSMAKLLFAMTLFGTLVLAALAPAGAAGQGDDLFHVLPGTTVHGMTVRADRVVIAGTLALDGPAAIVADKVDVLAGGRIEGASGLRGTPAVGDSAAADEGKPGVDVRIKATRFTVAPGGWVAAGSGGAGGLAVGDEDAWGGHGAEGGSVLVDAPIVKIAGVLAPGTGGQGGHAVSFGLGASPMAVGGSGGASGRVFINGLEGPIAPADAVLPASALAAALPCLPGFVASGCGTPSVADVLTELRRLLPGEPGTCGISLEKAFRPVDCAAIVADARAQVNETVAGVVADAKECVNEMPPLASVAAAGGTSAELAIPKAFALDCDAALDAIGDVLATANDLATCDIGAWSVLPTPWESCTEMAGILVRDAVMTATPGLPGLAGLASTACAQPQGKPGTTNPAGSGGDGGDACVSMVGQPGTAGQAGKDGVFGCSAGGPGGNGGNSGAAVANGGAGGHGMIDGGNGGSAMATSIGGDGGAGGRGGTRWGDPDCAGGLGGAGGNSGDATANGGAGGHGVCGAGGNGGWSTANSQGGNGGRGGSGTPPGLSGPPGTSGVAAANPGQGGLGPNVC